MKDHSRLINNVHTHFAFGENWRNYADSINEQRILSAVNRMQEFLGRDSLEGLSFVDIGCGSGIHSLAALRLGARSVTAFDFDPVSVETCRRVLSINAPASNWTCRVANVFELPSEWNHAFDVAYSWGVLHHTGDMWRAIAQAAKLVASDRGLFALALYTKTPLCTLWKAEKYIYSRLPSLLQSPILAAFSAVELTRSMLRGRNPITLVKSYHQKRGMSFWHDGHDWLGGYPYESASPHETVCFLERRGFRLQRSLRTESSLGITGTGCAEYLFEKTKQNQLTSQNPTRSNEG
jgi:2-polyprenyl-3-methyl-5-hydroxy-6-metoxy-1,4-benzoquinol methylase